MRLDQEDTSAFNTHLKSVRFSFARKILTTDAWITLNGQVVNAFDPNGGTWNVWLPENEPGRFYVVGNVGTSGTLVIKSAGGDVLNELASLETATLYSGEFEWAGTNTPLNLDVFGYTGPGHSEGLVPDPGAGPVNPDPALRRYLSELGWSTVTGGVEAGSSFFYSMKGGAVTITPLGTETLEFLSGNTGISVLAQGGTSPKSIRFTLNAANIDHNALLNYAADEHVAHSSVTLTAGLGLSGGGTIAASRTFAFDPSELGAIVNSASNYLVLDVPASGPRKALVSGLSTLLDHDTLVNFVTNEHIDHSTVSVVASTGLSGGGDLTTSRSLALDVNSLSIEAPAVGDFIPFYDSSGGDHNKTSIFSLNATLDHNALLNYEANRHFADAAVDGKQYVRKDGAWVEAIVSGSSATHEYQYNASTFSPPSSGSLRYNNSLGSLTTIIWLNYTNYDSVDLKNYFLQKVVVGDTFYIQDRDDSSKWDLFELTGAFTDSGSYATLPVTWLAGGAGLSAARVIVVRESGSVSFPVSEAPIDSTRYARENATWVQIPTISVGTTAPASPSVNDVWIDTN